MFNPLKAGRRKLLKAVPSIIKFLENAKRNGTMSPEKADGLIAQLRSESEEVSKEGEVVKEKQKEEEENGM